MGQAFLHGNGGANLLNFKVVGGTTAPSNPKENTIWVNKADEITCWTIGTTQPANPVEGMAWIATGTFSTSAFNALKKNAIQVDPIYAKQYVSGAWVSKTAKIYQNSSWVDLRDGRIYYNGNEFIDITGGFDSFTSNGGSCSKNSDHLKMVGGFNANTEKHILAGYKTAKRIDLTGYKTIYIDQTVTISKSNAYMRLYVSEEPWSGSLDTAPPNYRQISTSGVASLNISSIDKPMYVGVFVLGHTSSTSIDGYVYRIWME